MENDALYKSVREYMHEELGCSIIGQMLDEDYHSAPDFLGIKDKRGVSDNKIEIVALELEAGGKSLLDSLGEVLSYSLFAHRCYLAVFGAGKTSKKEMDFARKLGVGLVEVDARRGECKEALTSDYHDPLKPLGFEDLKPLESYICSSCGRTMFHLDPHGRFEFDLDDARPLYPEVLGSKETKSRLWLCPSCLKPE